MAGNNFCLFTRHNVLFWSDKFLQIGSPHLLTDNNNLKKITQDVLVRCLVIASDNNVTPAGYFQNLVGQCPLTDCYFQQ